MSATAWVFGSTRGGRGPSGWAAVIVPDGARPVTIAGGHHHSTANRMQLEAAVSVLEWVADHANPRCTIWANSTYLSEGVYSLAKWRAAGWRNAKTKLANVDLWQRVDQLLTTLPEVTWRRIDDGGRKAEPMFRAAEVAANDAMVYPDRDTPAPPNPYGFVAEDVEGGGYEGPQMKRRKAPKTR